jgi:hypothetical protein
MTRKITTTTVPQGERHSKTQAAKTTTDLENPTPHPRTPAEILAEQQNPTKPSPPPKPPASLPVVASATAATINQDKLDQWASLPQISIQFHGNNGTFDALDGSTVTDREFIALIPRVTRGFTRFHGKGVQPDVTETTMGDGQPDITRGELSDLDPDKWETGLDGTRRDPWQEHMTVPLIARDEAGDLYQFVARNKVSIVAVRQLLGRYRTHPRGKAGMLPVIKLSAVDYFNKRFNSEKPKPVLGIVGWVSRDGGSAVPASVPAPSGTPTAPASLPNPSDEFNDSIPW